MTNNNNNNKMGLVAAAAAASASSESTTLTNNKSLNTAHRAAAAGTLFGILLKLFSFLLSQITLRLVNPDVLGKASIQMDLMFSSVLFLGREGFRLALIRTTNANNASAANVQSITNVAWLSIPTGIVLSLTCLVLHLYHCEQKKEQQQNELEWQDYRLAGILYCLSALVESLAEPLVILTMRNLNVQTRATAEASATLLKAVLIAVLLIAGSSDIKFPVTIFGIGQLAHAVLFTSIFYYQTALRGSINYWPSLKKHQNFHWPTLELAVFFSIQSIFKHLLTEGDRIVLTALSHSYDQGLYAMGLAYGGMISRLIFQPMEENARLLFSRQHRVIMEQKYQQKGDGNDTQMKHNNQQSVVASAKEDLEDTFCVLVKLVLYVSLFACIASNYTSILLQLIAGSKWSSSNSSSNAASSVLSAFCYYTAFLALNGMTEAFVYGVAQSGVDVGKLGIIHATVGIFFAITAPLLVRSYQTVGLVATNGLCMILRSACSLYFAAGAFSRARQVYQDSLLSSYFFIMFCRC